MALHAFCTRPEVPEHAGTGYRIALESRRKDRPTHLLCVLLGPMDNPTYDEGISVLQLAEVTAQGGGYQNPVYSNVGPRSQSTSTPPAEESLYNEISGTAASSVTVCNVEVDAANRRRETKLNGAVAEAMTSGAMYDVVAQDFDRVKEESFYSALGKSAYATLEPHIPKASQQQLPPSDSEYSHLRH